MAKKERTPRKKITATIESLETIAKHLEALAAEFRDIQQEMRSSGKQEIELKNVTTLQNGFDNISVAIAAARFAAKAPARVSVLDALREGAVISGGDPDEISARGRQKGQQALDAEAAASNRTRKK